MPAGTATSLPTSTTGQLVVGDDVEYVGSIGEFVGRSFCVTGEAAVPTALLLACIGDGVRIPDSERRYVVENVSLGVRLDNVRRSSLLLLGV